MKRGQILQIKDLKNIVENDVFNFQYNEQVRKGIYDPNWCFDGQLICKKNTKEELYLVDTYWIGGDNKHFNLSNILERGSLIFVCNLNDVIEIEEYNLKYYADEDIYNLSYQHGCYKRFAIKKGATKNKDKILHSLNEELENQKSKKSYAENRIEHLLETKKKVENGDLQIYI